jgi:hypothetical protein
VVGDDSPELDQVGGLIGYLKAALDREEYLYLCALAVFPTLHPKLTVDVGGVLPDAEGVAILTEGRLASISRLPWFRRNRIPDCLRIALVRSLAGKPNEAKLVREAWTYLLEPEVEGQREPLELTVAPHPGAAVSELLNELLGRTPQLDDAILLAFMKSAPIPELALQVRRPLANYSGYHFPLSK